MGATRCAADVVVQAFGRTSAGVDGKYRLDGLPPGTWQVVAVSGGAAATGQAAVASGATASPIARTCPR